MGQGVDMTFLYLYLLQLYINYKWYAGQDVDTSVDTSVDGSVDGSVDTCISTLQAPKMMHRSNCCVCVCVCGVCVYIHTDTHKQRERERERERLHNIIISRTGATDAAPRTGGCAHTQHNSRQQTQLHMSAHAPAQANTHTHTPTFTLAAH